MRIGVLAAALAMAPACQRAEPGLQTGFAAFHARAQCLDPAGSPGAGLALLQCNESLEQSWRLAAAGAADGRTLFTLTSNANDLCVETPEQLGQRVRLEPCAPRAAQQFAIDAFNTAPSTGAFNSAEVEADTDLSRYAGFILHAAGRQGCIAIEGHELTLQPCVDPVSGRFNARAEWALFAG
jgi:hypothetical protein